MAESRTASNVPSADTARQAVEFGASMREMRRAHNRELADVAAILKIRQVYLQAIEEGRFNALPGRTYATGFIRAYADYLGLDLNEVMRRYREITGDQPAQTTLVPPSPVVEARLPTGFILLVAAILAVAVYGGWYYLTVDGRDPIEVVSRLPDRLAELVGLNGSAAPVPADEKPPIPLPQESKPAAPPTVAEEKVTRGAAPAPAPSSAPGDAVRAAVAEPENAPPAVPAEPAVPATVPATVPEVSPQPEPEAPSAVANATEAAPSGVAPAVTEPASTPEGGQDPVATTAQAPDAASTENNEAPPPAPASVAPKVEQPGSEAGGPARRVVLRASSITWVELRDRDGKRLYSRLMKNGETFSVPPDRGAVLETGNAGGLDILVDGTPIAPLGPQGAVRRDVLLEPDALLGRSPGGR